MTSRNITGSPMARIAGEAALRLRIRNGEVSRADLRAFEPPRFFETLLRGRRFDEVPDIVARICGICPVAHQVTAILALERACGIEVPRPIADLRRLLYLGEWIESHALHIYLLHAPDFLGAHSAIQLAATHAPLVEQALRLKTLGTEIVRVIGGRENHPVNLKVGGFYRLPAATDVHRLAGELAWALEAATATVAFTATLPFPHVDLAYECVSIREATGYPLLGGRLLSTSGLDLAPRQFEEIFAEAPVAPANARHGAARAGGAPYLVGPLARYMLNADRLGPSARAAADAAGLAGPCTNPYRSIVVRAVELVQCCEDALHLVRSYETPSAPSLAGTARATRESAWSEAPRGLLYHRYSMDGRGIILDATIVPPSAQNQRVMERDLAHVASANLQLPEDQLARRCEQAIRNYDPCISCATHVLRLEVDRE
jgi:coenzyme F420-reducing hydrogenase alpha subunit